MLGLRRFRSLVRGVSNHGAAPFSYVPCQAPKAQQPGLSANCGEDVDAMIVQR